MKEIVKLELEECTPDQKAKMDDYFVQSKLAEEDDDEIDEYVTFEAYCKNTDEFKSTMPYWIGWDVYGYDEIANSFGGGNIDEGVKVILKTMQLDYQTNGKTYRIIRE